MKKLIGTLVMVITFALGVAASAEYTASIEMQDGKIAVNGADSGTLIITSYSENGEKLNGVKTYDISEYTNGVPVADELLSLFSDGKIDRVNCMLWNDFAHMEPLAERLDIEDITIVSAKDYDADKTGYNASDVGSLYFYNNEGKSEAYKIGSNTKLYVNGVIYDDFDSGINRFIINNITSDVTLIDCTIGGSADGVYDSVFVNYYDTAIVDTIGNSDTDIYAIRFLAYTRGLRLTFNIDTENPDKSYRIFDSDGNAMDISEIDPYDVLSIRRNQSLDFNDSDFYDIIVSKEMIEGVWTAHDSDAEEYEINGKVYPYLYELVDGLDNEKTYTWYFDVFGRIAYAQEIEVPMQIAILDSVYMAQNGEHYEVGLTLKDGTKTTYTLEDTDIDLGYDTTKKNYDIASRILYDVDFADIGENKKADIGERVIEYSLNSENELAIVPATHFTYSLDSGYSRDGFFKPDESKISNMKIDKNATSFLLISDPDNVRPVEYSELLENKRYPSYFFDRGINSGVYKFVLILDCLDYENSGTNFAIYEKPVLSDDREKYSMLVNGEKKEFAVSDNCNKIELSAGTPVIYTTDSEAQIINIVKVAENVDFSSYNSIRTAAMADTDGIVTLSKNQDGILDVFADEKYKTDIIFGAVMGRGSGGTIDIIPIKDGMSDTWQEKNYFCDDDRVFYEMDYNKSGEEALSVGSLSAIYKPWIPREAYTDDSRRKFKWDIESEGININPQFALIKRVAGLPKDIYLITPYEE